MPIKLLQFAVLLFFICASALQNKCTKDPRSPAQPWAILHLLSVTEPAFPRENFDPIKPEFDIWLGLLDIWHTQGSAGKLSHVCSVQTDPLHTAHTAHLSLSRSSGFTVQPVLGTLSMGMGWADTSQKHCTHGTHVDHMCSVWQWDLALSLNIWSVTLLNQEEFYTLAQPSITALQGPGGNDQNSDENRNWADINLEYQERESNLQQEYKIRCLQWKTKRYSVYFIKGREGSPVKDILNI